jgi:hypothetical protein
MNEPRDWLLEQMPKEISKWRGVSGCVASAGQALCGLACLRALPETLGAATIPEIYFGICSSAVYP